MRIHLQKMSNGVPVWLRLLTEFLSETKAQFQIPQILHIIFVFISFFLQCVGHYIIYS